MNEKIFLEIKCDSCTIVEKKQLSARDIALYEEDYLTDALIQEGWKHMEGKDICPKCNKSIYSALLFHIKNESIGLLKNQGSV